YRFAEMGYPYFMTCTTVMWVPVFTRPETVNILLDSWRFLQTNRGLDLFGYVILENHLHFIASSKDLSTDIGDFKSFTARQIIDLLEKQRVYTLLDQLEHYKAIHKIDQRYQLWQEGSHPQQITNDDMMIQKLEYIHFNPLKRGYVDDPMH